MFKKTLISEFFTTINFSIFFETLKLLTFKLPELRYGESGIELENELLSYLGLKKSKILSFYNGRSALYHCLNIIGCKKNDEIIVNGYTCISVPNSIIQTGVKIVYSDINKQNLGFDLTSLEQNITSNTKAILVQHTFGKPSDIIKIKALASKYNILIIEDCAHSLGSKKGTEKLGGFGDFSIFSTGRDKVISSVTGGFLVINNKKYFSKIEGVISKLIMPSKLLVIKNLFYNIVGYLSYKSYDVLKIGRLLIYFSRKFNIITEILSKKEKECSFHDFNYALPNSLGFLAKNELEKVKIYSTHRRSLAEYYDKTIKNPLIKSIFKSIKTEKNNYFRYPVLLKNKTQKDKFYNYMKSHDVLLGNSWTGTNIAPLGSNVKNSGYIKGSCKKAENISSRILTLPNHYLINIDEAAKIVKLINNFEN